MWLSKVAAEQDRRGEREEAVEKVVSRLGWLREEERLWVEMYLVKRASFVQMAGVSGVDRRVLARRVRRLCRELAGREYEAVKRREGAFSVTEREVAYDHYLLGLGYRRIAGRRGLSEIAVRRMMGKVRAEAKSGKGRALRITNYRHKEGEDKDIYPQINAGKEKNNFIKDNKRK